MTLVIPGFHNQHKINKNTLAYDGCFSLSRCFFFKFFLHLANLINSLFFLITCLSLVLPFRWKRVFNKWFTTSCRQWRVCDVDTRSCCSLHHCLNFVVINSESSILPLSNHPFWWPDYIHKTNLCFTERVARSNRNNSKAGVQRQREASQPSSGLFSNHTSLARCSCTPSFI